MAALSSENWPDEFRKSCAHIVVSMYTEGALLYTPESDNGRWLLHYDPLHIEGSWVDHATAGKMIGYATCLTAAISLTVIRTGLNAQAISANMSTAVRAGLQAQRDLQIEGYQEMRPYRGGNVPDQSTTMSKGQPIGNEHAGKYPRFPTNLRFPAEELALSIKATLSDTSGLASTFFVEAFDQSALQIGDDWSIVNCRKPLEDVFENAKKYVEWGWPEGKPQADWGIPLCRFGGFIAIGREETEGLRGLRELIHEYKHSKEIRNPLSIAVFGAPGSGKSTAIREIAKDLQKNEEQQRELTFNLSQFTDASSIVDCLHQVRDQALSGHEPLVFWDEFDSEMDGIELGWLRYFLAPMQDGAFQSGSVTHRTGRAVFVFAGGTCNSMTSFSEKIGDKKNENSKGTDFKSRLKGFLNVTSINFKNPTSPDASTVFKRALQLRGHLLRQPGIKYRQPMAENGPNMDFINIDPGVLSAFLCVSDYKFASRSLQSIIEMSSLRSARTFGRSCLPVIESLGLHVNPTEFMRIVRDDGAYRFP